MAHSFADAERYAKQFDDPARDAWQMPDRVIAALNLKPGQSVADIGAGTGYFTARLAKSTAAPKVFAVDIEATMVSYLRTRAQRDLRAHPIPAGQAARGGQQNRGRRLARADPRKQHATGMALVKMRKRAGAVPAREAQLDAAVAALQRRPR